MSKGRNWRLKVEKDRSDGGTFVAALKADYAKMILNELCRLSMGKTRVIPTLGK